MAGGQEPRFPLGWGFYRDSQVMSLYGWPWLQHIQAGLKLSKAVPCLGSWDRAGGMDRSRDLYFDRVNGPAQIQRTRLLLSGLGKWPDGGALVL